MNQKTNAILVLSPPGYGKSTSMGPVPELGITGLPNRETYIVNVKGKPLPWKGSENHYKTLSDLISMGKSETDAWKSHNMLISNDCATIVQTLTWVVANRPDVKNVVIDDFQYLMSDIYMPRAMEGGFNKFNILAKGIYDVLQVMINMPGRNTAILAHSERTSDGSWKIKTIGKMIDDKISPEGLFTTVLYCHQEINPATRLAEKYFICNFDGQYPAKSPISMFPEIKIKNDLAKVFETMTAFYTGA